MEKHKKKFDQLTTTFIAILKSYNFWKQKVKKPDY